MPISVLRPQCGKTIKAPDAAAGLRIECPKCDAPLTLPADFPWSRMAGDPGAPPIQKGGAGLAITGLVLGIVGFVLSFIPCIGPILGAILGLLGALFSGIGLANANKAGGQGKGMAIAGLVLSILALVWAPIYWFMFVKAASEAADKLKEELEKQRRGGSLERPAVVAQAEPQSRAN